MYPLAHYGHLRQKAVLVWVLSQYVVVRTKILSLYPRHKAAPRLGARGPFSLQYKVLSLVKLCTSTKLPLYLFPQPRTWETWVSCSITCNHSFTILHRSSGHATLHYTKRKIRPKYWYNSWLCVDQTAAIPFWQASIHGQLKPYRWSRMWWHIWSLISLKRHLLLCCSSTPWGYPHVAYRGTLWWNKLPKNSRGIHFLIISYKSTSSPNSSINPTCLTST